MASPLGCALLHACISFDYVITPFTQLIWCTNLACSESIRLHGQLIRLLVAGTGLRGRELAAYCLVRGVLRRCVVQADFYPQLRAFLATPAGARYSGDFAFVDEDPSKDVLAARSTFRWIYFEDTVAKVCMPRGVFRLF